MIHPRTVPKAVLCGVLVLASVVGAGCGGDDDKPSSSPAVVRIGPSAVSQAHFERIFAKQNEAIGGLAGAPGQALFVPPDFELCSKGLRLKDKAKANAPAASLRRECAAAYKSYRRDLLRPMIVARWIALEARRQNVEATAAVVEKRLQTQAAKAFPKSEDPVQDLVQNLQKSRAVVLAELKTQQLETQLVRHAGLVVKPPTEKEILAFYAKRHKEFREPARRDLSYIKTTSRRRAAEALSLVQSGADWKQVATRFATSDVTNPGETLTAITKAGIGQKLSGPIFAAPEGATIGPIKGDVRWYVFKIRRALPAGRLTVDEVRSVIVDSVKARKQEKVRRAYLNTIIDRYRARTACAAGYAVPECKGGREDREGTLVLLEAPLLHGQ